MEGYQGNYQNGNYREVDFQFQRLAQNIGTNIQKILQNVSSIQRMMVQIGTPQDNQQLQNQVRDSWYSRFVDFSKLGCFQ